MRSLGSLLRLVRARARRRPGRWLLTVLGLACATAFTGAVAAQSTIAGDRAAHAVLSGLTQLDRAVRVTWPGVVTPTVSHRAQALLRGLGLGSGTEVVLLDPVRLSGVVVRPVAINPLPRWVAPARSPGPCRPGFCPMLLAEPSLGAHTGRVALTATGVRIVLAGRASVRSAAPLGFTPQPSGQPPVLLTSDVRGLEGLPGLSGVYRTHSWVALTPASGLHAWQLAALEHRLHQAETRLLVSGSAFSLMAPFDGLDAARAQAAAAPTRLLLAAGGALAALALFVVLAVGGLRRDVDAELTRLRTAGATAPQCGLFVGLEAGFLSGVALAAGAILAITIAAIEARVAGVPVAGALAHSLLTPAGAAALIAGWGCAVVATTSLLLIRGSRLADVLSVAAVAALALALSRGASSGSDPLPVLLAPLACLAAGVLVFRGAALLLQGGERLLRRGPVLARLAFVGLARAPATPSLAIAFIAVSTGLGGFALAYRATLLRSAADQAADRVPLDATVAAGASFTTPLEIAPLWRWQSIARGPVAPVRRTEASYVSGASSVTVPALGVPAAALKRLHGWRSGDGSAPLDTLARRLIAPGPIRSPGPSLPAGADSISLRAQARGIGVIVVADLRDRYGNVQRVTLGQASTSARRLSARVPGSGQWELEALELSEPTGLEITDAHQEAENIAATTRFSGWVTLGPPSIGGHRNARFSIASWRALGAAGSAVRHAGGLRLRFAESGQVGLIRPRQPSDKRPVPVLVDPQTTASAGQGGDLALTIDGLPVAARVVGTLKRFPSLGADTSGFVVADEQTLASALDAESPGQGQPDELWISTPDPAGLRRALQHGRFAALTISSRPDIEQRLRSAPIARAVLGALLAGTVVSGVLAILGLLVALLGAARDERVERDLLAQGVGPRALRSELRLRLILAAALGVGAGLGIGVLLTRLAVATVQAAGTIAVPRPPVVTVAPWAELALWASVAILALSATAWLATRAAVGERTR